MAFDTTNAILLLSHELTSQQGFDGHETVPVTNLYPKHNLYNVACLENVKKY